METDNGIQKIKGDKEFAEMRKENTEKRAALVADIRDFILNSSSMKEISDEEIEMLISIIPHRFDTGKDYIQYRAAGTVIFEWKENFCDADRPNHFIYEKHGYFFPLFEEYHLRAIDDMINKYWKSMKSERENPTL